MESGSEACVGLTRKLREADDCTTYIATSIHAEDGVEASKLSKETNSNAETSPSISSMQTSCIGIEAETLNIYCSREIGTRPTMTGNQLEGQTKDMNELPTSEVVSHTSVSGSASCNQQTILDAVSNSHPRGHMETECSDQLLELQKELIILNEAGRCSTQPIEEHKESSRMKLKTIDYTSIQHSSQNDSDHMPTPEPPGITRTGGHCGSRQQRKRKAVTSTQARGEVEKAKRRKCRTIDMKEAESVLDGIEGEIDQVLEQTAERNKLTTANIKSILKHVITNEHVLAMVRNTMKAVEGSGDTEEAVFEPKLTRSRVRELREKQVDVPWPVSPLKPLKAPATQQLLEKEFSEDENSSDEEYSPAADAELQSEDDDETFLSPLSDAASEPSLPATPKLPEVLGDSVEDSLLVEERRLEINLEPEEDTIALRTRSKLPLTDTSLETIESAFIAPDITTDMYDVECDDEEWKAFLSYFAKPVETNECDEGDAGDDEANDPEYNFLEEEEDELDKWDLRNDKAVKISRKELHELVAELLEAAHQELGDAEDEEDTSCTSPSSVPVAPSFNKEQEVPQVLTPLVSFHETAAWTPLSMMRLEEQMRQHVQLATQAFLLSTPYAELNPVMEYTALFLTELQNLSRRVLPNNRRSAFAAENLDEAVRLVQNYKCDPSSQIPQGNMMETCLRQRKPAPIPTEVMKAIAGSPVFIYPRLLPKRGWNMYKTDREKVLFTPADDQLIAMGLEQFMPLKNGSVNAYKLISNIMLPSKTEKQIRLRVKNVRGMKALKNNPIVYYFKHKKAPEVPRSPLLIFPPRVKPPCKMPMAVLPRWMSNIVSSMEKSQPPILPSAQPLHILPTTPPKPSFPLHSTAQAHFMLHQPLPVGCETLTRKYSRILPRTPPKYISPLKQISPILKKYGRHMRRILPKLLPDQPDRIETIPVAPQNQPLQTSDSKPVQVEPSMPLTLLEDLPSNDDDDRVEQAPEVENHSEANANSSTPGSVEANDSISPDASATVVASIGTADEVCPIQLTEDAEAAGECESQSEIDTCEDGEGEDEALDNEKDIAALMAASSTICRKHPPIKKKNKQLRELESTLLLLVPDLLESDPLKEERELAFAQSYLIRVKEVLKEEEDTFISFLRILCEFEKSSKTAVQLFEDVRELLSGYPSLVDDFVAFLLPEQARDCGKLAEYLTLTKIRKFIRKLEIHFSRQPQYFHKILRMLSHQQHQTDISSETLRMALLPLLRGQSHLVEEFLQLLPDEPPPESLMADFEEITIPDSEGDNSGNDSCEEIVIPDTDNLYGTKQCPCSCHTTSSDPQELCRSRHCLQCGIKFIDGRIYIQRGKFLRPAQVTFGPQPPEPPEQGKGEELRSDSPVTIHSSESPLSSLSLSPIAVNCVGDPEAMEETELQVFRQEETGGLSLSPAGSPMMQESPKPGPTSVSCESKNSISVLRPMPTLASVIDDTIINDEKDSTTSSPTNPPDRADRLASPVSPPFGSRECETYIPNQEIVNGDRPRNQDSISDIQATDDRHEQTPHSPQSSTVPDHSDDQTALFRGGPPKWTREEDRILLHTCQQLGTTKEAFIKVMEMLQDRQLEEIQGRFQELMQLLTAEGSDEEQSDGGD